MRIYYPLLAALLLCSALQAQAYDAQTIRDYIDRYKYIAVEEMESHGIPASITLAQGILESGAGTSQLAAKSNNHFGIKCHKGWKGGKVYHDDDAKGECFRKYKNPEASFKDHSAFLTTRGRYAFLFELEKTDYKGWARGLKKAGYATNPKYANLLIRLIEDYGLASYDTGLPGNQIAAVNTKEEPEVTIDTRAPHVASEVFYFNRIKTVKARSGDTPEKLANEHGIRLSWLLRYNNMLRGDEQLEPGTHFYLQPKRKKGANKYHVVQAGETMESISRDQGIRLDMLYKRNLVDRGFEPAAGEQLYLRKSRLNPPARRARETPPQVRKPLKQNPQELALPSKKTPAADKPQTIERQPENLPKQKEPEIKIEPQPAATLPKTEVEPEVIETKKPVMEQKAKEAVFHQVEPGENLYRISLKYDTTVEELMQLNKLPDHNISIGQQLIVGEK